MMIILTNAALAALHITYGLFFLFFNLKVQQIKLFIKTEIYTKD